ncbi:MAG: hypothetical protein IPN17_32855 [Deltaproteobacteria bacterium]|nr:hypothetical protein [Deltaproteobacteria bacterium]
MLSRSAGRAGSACSRWWWTTGWERPSERASSASAAEVARSRGLAASKATVKHPGGVEVSQGLVRSWVRGTWAPSVVVDW